LPAIDKLVPVFLNVVVDFQGLNLAFWDGYSFGGRGKKPYPFSALFPGLGRFSRRKLTANN
jgi:hypothetical protein